MIEISQPEKIDIANEIERLEARPKDLKIFPIVGATVLTTGNRLRKIPSPVCFLTFA